MSAKIAKLIVLVSLSLSLLFGTSACKKVTVVLPSNGCNVTACTNEPTSGGVYIK